jgi:hypothetical protein
MLAAKLERLAAEAATTELTEQETMAAREARRDEPARRSSRQDDDSFLEDLSKNTMVRQAGRTVVREVTRGLLGAFLGKRR